MKATLRLFTIFCFLLLAVQVYATERFVDSNCSDGSAYNPTGNGGNGSCTGGSSLVYASPQGAINAAGAGDIITIRGRTFTSNGSNPYGTHVGWFLSFSSPTQESQRITIRNYSGEQVTFTPSTCGSNDYYYQIYAIAKSFITIDGTNGRSTNPLDPGIVFDQTNCPPAVHGYVGIYFTNESNSIIVKGVEIKNMNGDGISISGNDAYVAYNSIHDSTSQYPSWSQAVYVNGSATSANNWTVENNEIYNLNVNDSAYAAVYSIVICPSGGTCENTIVRNNLIHDGFSCIYVAGAGSNRRIYNNICHNTWGMAGIRVANGSSDKIYSNTVYNTDRAAPTNYHAYDGNDRRRYGFSIETNDNEIKNNITYVNVDYAIYNNGSGNTIDHNFCGDGNTCGSSYQSGNPLFTNPGSGDFTLQSGSSAINTGTDLGSSYNTDYAGIARPQGAGWDIGAYEYQSPPTFPGNTLEAAYGMETGSGTTAVDSTLNQNDGSFVGGASWALNGGRYGHGIALDGKTGYVSVPDDNSLDFTQSFTVSAWVKPGNVHTDWRAIAVKNYNLYLYATENGNYCAQSGIFAGFLVNGSQQFYVCDTTPLPINIWTHLAVTYDGPDGNLRLYRNGVLVPNSGASVGTRAAAGYIEPTDQTLMIGNSVNNEPFEGTIDEVRLYNFAIPRTSTNNTTPLNPCHAEEYTVAGASVVGDMNCPVIYVPGQVSAFSIDIGSAFKLGPSSTFSLGQ